ncbi:MAG: hypothetical protein JO139_01670 [Alphaproteobacteria bacterium]|nr:hypothetical protein [Alphaproteobacteria bacterium]
MRMLLAAASLLLATLSMAEAQMAQPVAALPIVQRWIRFVDPQEMAFQIELPQGWQNAAGTARLNALQFRNWVATKSPDGLTIVAINDPREWSYIAPSPLVAAAGFRPGSLYNGGGGTVYTVAPRQSGQQYSASWGLRRLAELCSGAHVVDSRPRPDLAERFNVYSRPFGIIRDVGEATFVCQKDNLSMTAYALASMTYLGQTGIWYYDGLAAFLAPAPVSGVAAGVLAHMVGSFQFNPQWLARVSNTAADIARAAAQSNAAISDSIMRGWEARGAVMDKIMEAGSRARLGIDIYSDPGTGTQYTVAAGHNFYWANPQGRVVGTDADTAPPGFGRLNHVPP